MGNKIMEKLKSFSFLFLGCLLCIYGCKDDAKGEEFDPSKPVVIDRFYPESSKGQGELFIYGENFGTDISKINVTVSGKKAIVIGSNGHCIYCVVPIRAGDGKVSVRIGNTEEHVFDKEFKYEYQLRVGTLCGFTDKDGKTARVDGTLKEAQFEAPYWLEIDDNGDLFLLENNRSVRRISIDGDKVSTLLVGGQGQGISSMHSMCFSPTKDTLLVANQVQGDDNGKAVVMLFKDKGYSGAVGSYGVLAKGKGCDAVAMHPQDGTCFFTQRADGYVYKLDDPVTGKKSQHVTDGNSDMYYAMQFHPSGDFVYLTAENKHVVFKSTYNRETRSLSKPLLLCGARRNDEYNVQWSDGVGEAAKFSQPRQGTFDEEGNFYVCDRYNHCIRKISQEGKVETFAGRPNEKGYADGELTKAQFNQPSGIVYVKETKTFYIADENNYRIRTITAE